MLKIKKEQNMHQIKAPINKYFVPVRSWFKPALAFVVPADHKDRIFPNILLDQWRPSADVVDKLIWPTKSYVKWEFSQ